MAEVRVLLQAGGRGERLRPATDTTPKPLLDVDGVPMVERLLRQMLAAGLRDFTVVTGWLGHRIEEHFRGLDFSNLDVQPRFYFVREDVPLGNAGAMSLVADGDGPVLLVFGDLVTDLDFGALLDLHRARGTAITLASHYESFRVRLGELLTEGDAVVGYKEKPLKHFLICSGIGVFEPAALQLIEPGRPTGISELVMAAISHGLSVSHWVHGAFWMDVNSPEALQEASAALAQIRSGTRSPTPAP